MQKLILNCLGIIGLLIWLVGFRINPTRSMYGYLFSFLSTISIPLGCMAFVLIQHSARVGWSVLLRRVAEFGMAVMPLFSVLFLPVLIFQHDIFAWGQLEHMDEILIKKIPYLNFKFFTARAILYFAAWNCIAIWFYKKSLTQDITGQTTKETWKWTPLALILFSITITFASFDWIMSLQPHWYSTVFGVYFFAGCFLSGISFISIAGIVSNLPINKNHYHDLGKFLFGFTIFWAYIAFSQFMLYWYANIPEEVEFYIKRLEHGWQFISWGMIVINFLVPFLLLMSRHSKRNKFILIFACVWIILAHSLDMYWLIIPAAGDSIWFKFILYDMSILIAMSVAFLKYYQLLTRDKFMYPKREPRLQESLTFENH